MAHSQKENNFSLENDFFKTEVMFLYDYHTLKILDANDSAVIKYGISKKDLIGREITTLGERYSPEDLKADDNVFPESIWLQSNIEGDQFYVQYTSHQINYRGKLAQVAIAHDITDKIDNISRKLHELPRVDTMRSIIPLATIEWDNNANVRDWSDTAEKIFGWSYADLIGKNLFDIGILPNWLLKKAEENIRTFVEHQKPYFTINSEHITREGAKIYCTWHNAAIYDQGGKLLSIYSLVEDITEKRLAEEHLRESELRFRVLSEASLVGVYMLQGGQFKYVNPRFTELTGYTKSELLDNIGPFELIHDEDKIKIQRLREMWLASEIDSFEIDAKGVTKQQQIFHVKVYGSKIVLGEKPAVIGVVVDQTKQVEATEKFKISVDSYRDLFDSIGDSIYILDKNGFFIEVNKSALESYGYSRNEFLGKELKFLAAPGKVDLDRTAQFFEKAMSGVQQRFEWWGKRKSGEIFPEEVHLNPGSYFGDEVVIAISRDMSTQFEQQKELKENEQLFRQLFQNAPIGIALLDEHHEIVKANEGFEEIFGYQLSEIKGLDIDSVIAPEEQIEEAKLLSNSSESFEASSIRKKVDGSLIDVLIYGVPVKVDGKTIAIYGIYVDITDRKEAERKILQSLKEKEVLLSEIHHRVKNNLAVITGLLELQSHQTSSIDARKALKDSQMRINSMALIHEKLYQNETLSRIEFDLYVMELTEVIRKSHMTTNSNIEVKFDTEKIELSITQAIPCGLLLNEILTNAFKHAFPPNFKKKPHIYISLKKEKGSEIALVIEDNGVGLPDTFENMGKRSLGFTLIKTLTKQIHADIDIKTGSKKGTTYSFTFEKEEI